MPKHTTYLALGSNLGNRENTLASALNLIADRVGEIVVISAKIETKPEGYESDNFYLNQVVEVQTELGLEELLLITQDIERALGRLNKSTDVEGYSDRTCDIDIIFYDDIIYQTEYLSVPHARFREREFVLVPLAEIAPKKVDPVTGKTILQLLWDVC